ncbi:glycosyltransferase family 8 protein [Dothistroma septosporum NZE10]|uniref:Glycosyltransferase family 8 protein n=1 Tax=Dothistroma septosporum (strain NZE10 / CBS 128990) TaxID=675120 RepID=N1PBF9_DOTSN|nr:glycosyltransferase family 8 protein [Dothistroma septosporum NZE10]
MRSADGSITHFHTGARRIDDAFAFATFLGADSGHSEDKNGVDEDDDYFMSVRQLVYQLLHSAKAAHLPVLVLCTPEVAPSKIVKLEADGATIVNVQQVRSSWLHTSEPRWADMLTKLQLFGLTNFTKICYLDADTLVLGDLSGIFHDPATAFQSTLADAPQARLSEIQLPESYTLAGHIDYGWYTGHVLSTEIGADAYMNAGFFVFAPSQALFDYYSALLEHQGLFDPYMMEQSLLNYAHHRQSNMPWQPLSPMWNVNWPTKQDLDAGVLSFHDKYWEGALGVSLIIALVSVSERAHSSSIVHRTA